MNGSLWIVARASEPTPERVYWHVFDNRLRDNSVAARGEQHSVGLEFGEDERVDVVRVRV